jgi:hypothetical protein
LFDYDKNNKEKINGILISAKKGSKVGLINEKKRLTPEEKL